MILCVTLCGSFWVNGKSKCKCNCRISLIVEKFKIARIDRRIVGHRVKAEVGIRLRAGVVNRGWYKSKSRGWV